MKARIVNEKRIQLYNGKYIKAGGHIITNPGEYDLIRAGYRDFLPADPPSVSEGERAEGRYAERDGRIYQYWIIKKEGAK